MRSYRSVAFAVFCAALCAVAAFSQTQPFAGNLLLVDDDGVQCPGALRTIQEAVARAGPGATILVCPGVYRKAVNIVGAAKSGLRLIAIGLDDEVVLEGDHTEPYGFYLEDTDNILIRGFTIREWGNKPTTANQSGNGCGIHAENSHYNIFEHNRIHKTDMMGITLGGSANNTIRYNYITEIDPKGYGQGIALFGKKSTGNLIFQNRAALQPGSGILIWGAGTGNVVVDNDLNNNGGQSIGHYDTEGTLIEGNRLSYNDLAGYTGCCPPADPRSKGIDLSNSDKVTIFGNMIHNNTLFDISWDKKGDISFVNNACGKANQPGICGQ